MSISRNELAIHIAFEENQDIISLLQERKLNIKGDSYLYRIFASRVWIAVKNGQLDIRRNFQLQEAYKWADKRVGK